MLRKLWSTIVRGPPAKVLERSRRTFTFQRPGHVCVPWTQKTYPTVGFILLAGSLKLNLHMVCAFRIPPNQRC